MSATTDVVPLVEASIEIAAPPSAIWPWVSDLTAIAELSPQVVRTVIREGGPGLVGTRAVNLNRRGLIVWPTQSKVIEAVPERRFAFRVKDNKATWVYELEPLDGIGTRVTHRREMNEGTTAVSATLIGRLLGGQPAYAEEIRRGMMRTLNRLKAVVESDSRATPGPDLPAGA